MATPRKPPKTSPTDRENADPDELRGPADFARVCGHSSTHTLSNWMKTPPPGFPEPDSYQELPTRRRPLWRLHRMWDFADNHQRHPAPPPGPQPRTQDHARLAIARKALQQAPGGSTNGLARHLADQHGASVTTWRRLIDMAR